MVGYLVIGGGIAGTTCVEELLQAGEEDVILLTAAASVKRVNRVQKIGKALSEIEIAEAVAKEWYGASSIQVHTASVQSLDIALKTVVSCDGATFTYDKLCICTGARPRLIFKHPNVIGIRDMDSVSDLVARMPNARRIAVVGNGGIAMEFVHHVRDCQVFWVIKDSHVGNAFFDEQTSEALMNMRRVNVESVEYRVLDQPDQRNAPIIGPSLGPDWTTFLPASSAKGHCLEIFRECEIASIEDTHGDWPLRVHLSSGTCLDCDFVVSATGVIPNTAFVDCSVGRSPDGGLLVNERLMTNVEDVYAAGDCCTANWNRPELWIQMRLWNQARHMGAAAAHCMLSSSETIRHIPFELFAHSTRFFGHKVVLLGLYNGQGLDDSKIMERRSEVDYVRVVLKEGRLKGAVLLGDTGLEETFENLLLSQMDIGFLGDRLLHTEFDLEDFFD